MAAAKKAIAAPLPVARVTPANVGGAIYVPPPVAAQEAPPSPVVRVGEDVEIALVQAFVDANVAGVQVRPIAETSRQWRACDVFVDLNGLSWSANAVISVIVYAIHPGGRSVVASGRLGLFTSGVATGPVGPQHVVAFRGNAQRYAVELVASEGPALLVSGNINVSVVCSNEDSTPANLVGVMHAVPSSSIILTTALVPALSLVGVTAINSDANAKIVRVYDAATNPAAAPNLRAIFQFGLEPVIGASGQLTAEMLRGYRFRNGISIQALTWPGAVVDANVSIGALVQ